MDNATSTLKRFPNIQGIGPTAAKLIDAFSTMSVGDQFTDEQLASICGKDTSVSGEGYAALQTAIRYVLKHSNKVIQRVRGASAVKCLESSEIVEAVTVDLGIVRRRSRRAVFKLNSVDQTKLDNDERIKANALMAQHGAISFIGKSDSTKKLVTRNASAPADVKGLLELMA